MSTFSIRPPLTPEEREGPRHEYPPAQTVFQCLLPQHSDRLALPFNQDGDLLWHNLRSGQDCPACRAICRRMASARHQRTQETIPIYQDTCLVIQPDGQVLLKLEDQTP